MGEREFFSERGNRGLLKNPASECQTQCKALEDTWPGDRPDTKRGVEGCWHPVFARPSAQDVGDGRFYVGKVVLLEDVGVNGMFESVLVQHRETIKKYLQK